MAFVFCTDRLCHLPSEQLQTLYDDIRRHVAAACAEEELQALTCRGFELFGPDKSHLIARFRAPGLLMQLRRAIWRTCKEFGTSLPDAIWQPHIRLGRIKASRGQLNKVAFSLPPQLSQLAIQPKGLTLRGKQPKDPYCECNWDIIALTASARGSEAGLNAIPNASPEAGRASAPAYPPSLAQVDMQQAAAEPCAASAPAHPASLAQPAAQQAAIDPCVVSAPPPRGSGRGSGAALSAPPPRASGFVAELPKLRRPMGEPGASRPAGMHTYS